MLFRSLPTCGGAGTEQATQEDHQPITHRADNWQEHARAGCVNPYHNDGFCVPHNRILLALVQSTACQRQRQHVDVSADS